MSEAEVVSLRAEIKAWEREFRVTHNREPSIQDIKDNGVMTAKYKRYKALSKAQAMSTITKPRILELESPLAGPNPFSPRKKAKQVVIPQSPSMLIDANGPDSGNAIDGQLYRARKRLRGEPVSPSPKKEKRPRIASSGHLLFAGKTSQSTKDAEHIETEDLFVDTSPCKATRTRSFKSLFQDNKRGNLSTAIETSENQNQDLPNKRPKSKHPIPEDETEWFSQPTPAKNSIFQSFNSSVSPGIEGRSTSQSDGRKHEHIDPLLPPSPPLMGTPAPEKKIKVGTKSKNKTSSSMAVDDTDDSDKSLRIEIIKHKPVQPTVDPELDDQHLRNQGEDIEADVNERVLVSLPDSLKEMLHVSSDASKTRVIHERQAVHSLLYGRREGHYDADKGGEIWEAGEYGIGDDTDGDDDWEGEPIPWEYADL